VFRLVVDACAAPQRVRSVLGLALRDVVADYDRALTRAEDAERRAVRLADAADTMRDVIDSTLARTADLEARLERVTRRAELAEAALDDATRLLGERTGA
jgi:hypothetical protein